MMTNTTSFQIPRPKPNSSSACTCTCEQRSPPLFASWIRSMLDNILQDQFEAVAADGGGGTEGVVARSRSSGGRSM